MTVKRPVLGLVVAGTRLSLPATLAKCPLPQLSSRAPSALSRLWPTLPSVTSLVLALCERNQL